MESLFLLIATTFILTRSGYKFGFKKYSIARSGCTLLLPGQPGRFSTSYTRSGDLMHFGETVHSGITYGSVTIELQQQLQSLAEAEKVLAQFLQTLQASFDIDHTCGLTLGLTQAGQSRVRGAVDYWQDADGTDWKVKGWTNGGIISVLYIKNITALPVAQHELYLDSFCFG